MEDLANDDDAYFLVVAENENDPDDASSNETVLTIFGLNNQEANQQSSSSDKKQNLSSSSSNDVYKLIMANMNIKQDVEECDEDLYFVEDSDGEFNIKKAIKEGQDNGEERGTSESEDYKDEGASSHEEEGEADELAKIIPKNASEDDVIKSFKAALLDAEKRGAYRGLEVPDFPSHEDGSFKLPYYLGDEDENYECKFCNHSANNEGAAARHYSNKHGPRAHKCLACGSRYRRIDYLLKHESRCTAQYALLLRRARASIVHCISRPDKATVVPCIVCDKLIRKSNMSQHVKVHTDEFYYPCSRCPARYRTVKTLEAHERAHSGARPYQCDQCPNAYTSRTSLSKHRVTHGEALYFCDYCARGFVRKDHLVNHIKTHDGGTKRFLCKECGKRFTQKFTLENHLRKHKGLPPKHRCTQCNRRFGRMSVLKVHMKKDHNLNLITKKMFYNRMPEMPSHEITKIIKEDTQGKFVLHKVGKRKFQPA